MRNKEGGREGEEEAGPHLEGQAHLRAQRPGLETGDRAKALALASRRQISLGLPSASWRAGAQLWVPAERSLSNVFNNMSRAMTMLPGSYFLRGREQSRKPANTSTLHQAR
eukprot:2996319-Pyramimonas_sp.AAC.1